MDRKTDNQAGGLSLFPNSSKLNRKKILENSVVFFFFFLIATLVPRMVGFGRNIVLK